LLYIGSLLLVVLSALVISSYGFGWFLLDLLLTAFLHFNDELEEFGDRVISQFKEDQTKVTLTVPNQSVVRELSAPDRDAAFACGYETATETRKAQEQAIASAEQSISWVLI
jgi:hypothetical protein